METSEKVWRNCHVCDACGRVGTLLFEGQVAVGVHPFKNFSESEWGTDRITLAWISNNFSEIHCVEDCVDRCPHSATTSADNALPNLTDVLHI